MEIKHFIVALNVCMEMLRNAVMTDEKCLLLERFQKKVISLLLPPVTIIYLVIYLEMSKFFGHLSLSKGLLMFLYENVLNFVFRKCKGTNLRNDKQNIRTVERTT